MWLFTLIWASGWGEFLFGQKRRGRCRRTGQSQGVGSGEVEAEVAIEKVQQNARQRQQLEVAYQQTCGAIAALYELALPEEGV